MRIDAFSKHTARPGALVAAAFAAALSVVSPAPGAVIGVLSDGRQSAYLSLMGDSSAAARLALTGDGHELVELTSLSLWVLNTVDVLWLPLLDSAQSYTAQERTDLVQYIVDGGRVIWIGDADVFNTSDNSFLSAFGMSKRTGNLNTPLAPAIATHPVVTGPHGTVALVGTNAGYGLFDSLTEVADVFVGDPGPGTFAGFMDADSGFIGAGRVALVCEASIFGQLLDQDDHRAMLRNLVKWAEAAPGYTPSGTDMSTGPLTSGCGACTTIEAVFATVTATGETTVTEIGSGRCGFQGIAQADLPEHFVGYGFDLATTAALPDPAGVTVTVTYDGSAMASMGITDEAALKLYWHDTASGQVVDVTTAVDVQATTVMGLATGAGTFLVGAPVPTADCNADGTPDPCEIDKNSTAPGGPFFCETGCDPDCNDNGIPDACDISGGSGTDCNGNGTLDECEPPVQVTFIAVPSAGGTVTPNGSESHTLCDVVNISATANGGYCFSGWTVDTGADANDPAAPQTTVIADTTKTVSAQFTEIIIQQPVDADACTGGQVSLGVGVHADYAATAQYQWARDGTPLAEGSPFSGVNTANLTIDPASGTEAGTYTCTITLNCGTATTNSATLTVSDSAQIATEPSDQAACPGDPVTFTVSATGTNPAFQWQFASDVDFLDIADGQDITGAASDTLVLSNITAAQAGQYRCVVTADCGSPATSQAATLSVGQPVQIDAQPADAFACSGDDAVFTVSVSGSSLAYQWRFNGSDISGATTDTWVVGNVQASDAGAYDCVVTGGCGSPVTSTAAALTVGEPAVITDGPADATACPNDTVAFTVSAGGTGVTFQWQHDDGGGSFQDIQDGGHIGGADSAALTLSGVTAADAGDYRCTVTGLCSGPSNTDPATLTVNADAEIMAGPEDQTICPGQAAAFGITASGTNLQYQWQFNGGSAFGDLADGGDISGATSATLTLSNPDPTREGQYRCIVTGDCGAALTSGGAVLTLSPGACDCNGNGTLDAEDLATGTSEDCNGNGIPDSCDITDGTSSDCNGNGVPDTCDITSGNSPDCNANSVPDECEIDAGSSAPGGPFFCTEACNPDCNADGVPDACQLDGNDCNGNGVPDECEPLYVADAGQSFTLCAAQTSLPLGGPVVASGSTPPYTYRWQILLGPDGGGTLIGETDERARFVGTIEGVYEIELEVSDASAPPCVVTDVVSATVTSMSVDTGQPFALCAGGTSEPLAVTVNGGTAPYSYQWSIDDGSISTSPAQFTGDGAQSERPTFTPDGPGPYVLRITVQDANNPPCVATNTIAVNAVQLQLITGDDFAMCVQGESEPLELIVPAPGTEPLTYAWSIDPASPSTAASQFGGTGPQSAHPTFRPSAVGPYLLQVTVRDASTPPCEETATVRVSVDAMTVDAGPEGIICVGGNGARLEPAVQGGQGELIYAWSIEPGSPSLDPAQFIDPHAFAASPRFVPSALGSYTLLLTVTDSGTPPCVATDTVVVRASTMTIDAGEDFVTQAFRASRGLGALPLVGGGDGPFTYTWAIVGGPERDPAQLSAADAEHPLFTPARVGTYEIRITVTDANGSGCAVSDAVAIEAIASVLTLPVNEQGRVFMSLRIDAPYTRSEVRIHGGAAGVQVTGELYDDGKSASFAGLTETSGLARRTFITSQMPAGSFVAVVVMYWDDTELAGLDAASMRLSWFDGQARVWRPTGMRPLEQEAYPRTAKQADVGRHGIDRANSSVWAVVDYWGEFSIGVPLGDGATPEGAPAGTGEPGISALDGLPADACGATAPCGAGTLIPLTLGSAVGLARRRRRPQPR